MHLLNNVHALNKELCLTTSVYGIESTDYVIPDWLSTCTCKEIIQDFKHA